MSFEISLSNSPHFILIMVRCPLCHATNTMGTHTQTHLVYFDEWLGRIIILNKLITLIYSNKAYIVYIKMYVIVGPAGIDEAHSIFWNPLRQMTIFPAQTFELMAGGD